MGNTQSVVPYGAQTNQIQTTLQCSYGSGSISEVDLSLFVTAPLAGGSGQQFQYSDFTVKAALNAPFNTYTTAGDYYVADVSINFNTPDASPSTYTYTDEVFNSQSDPVVHIPGKDIEYNQQPAQALGPFTLGSSGNVHRLYLEAVTIGLKYQSGQNATLNCPASDILISSVAINGGSGPLLAPTVGYAPDLPTNPANVKATVANIPISCNVKNGGSVDFNYSIQANQPSQIYSGEQFDLYRVQTFFTLANSVVQEFASFYGDGQSIVGVGLGVDNAGNNIGTGVALNVANASPSSLDLARDFTASDANDTPNPLQGGYRVYSNDTQPLVLALPLDGSLTVGPFTPGSTGSIFGISVGGLVGAAAGYSTTQQLLEGSFDWSCSIPYTFELFGSKIR